MWRYSDTNEPFDESILIASYDKYNYYSNIDKHLSYYEYDDEYYSTNIASPKQKSYFLCCFCSNT